MNDERPLGMRHVAAVVVGAIIGVGIFFTPAALALALPSSRWVLAMWLLGGVASVASALVYAELGGRFPAAGGIYVFLREGFGKKVGPLLAFQYGFLQLSVVQPGAMAAIALVLVDHVLYLTGDVPSYVRTGGAILAIATFTGANLLGLKTGGKIQLGVAAMKIAALLALVVIGIVWGRLSQITSAPAVPRAGSAPSWLLAGLIPVIWSFGGAYHGTFIAGSVRQPEKAVPRGILLGVLVVLLGYLAVNVAFLSLLSIDGLAASKSPAADATEKALGPLAGKALDVTIVLSAAGILNTVCLGFPFVLYAMAQDGLFIRRAARLNPRTGRPSVAVALQGLFACIAVVVGASRVDVLIVGIAFADALFQLLVAVALIRARSTPAPAGTLRAPLLATIVTILLNGGIAVGTLIDKPRQQAIGVALLFVGLVAYASWRKRA